MKQVKIQQYELSGSYYEIGRQEARRIASEQMHILPPKHFSDESMEEALECYKMFCPGLLEELRGFSDESGIPMEEMAYTWMTYLVPRCSGLAINGGLMEDGHTRILRNYEFGIDEEDMTICKTSVSGKYAHIGGTVVCFGRSEGINEKGLAISMSSCGMPVSNMEGMRAPEVKGLQFWAVIRILLEECKDVEEAIDLMNTLPVGYNINLYLADANGTVALYETINGHNAYEIKDASSNQYVFGTNHIAIKELHQYEPFGMKNSVIRYENIEKFMQMKGKKTEKELFDFALTPYPQGITCFQYQMYMGTIKTIVMDANERRFTICWMGQKTNGFQNYYVSDTIEPCSKLVEYEEQLAEPDMFFMQPLN